MNQLQVYICPHPLEPPSHLPFHPTPVGDDLALDLSFFYHTANVHWQSNFTYGDVYVLMLLSQFIPSLLSPYICNAILLIHKKKKF